jgi:predicted RecB family nuclease
MRRSGATFQLSASDLVKHLNCRHLTVLDRAVAEGALAKPKIWDPLLQILAERGSAHEEAYIEHLQAAGFEVVRLEGFEVTDAPVAETLAAMQRGAQVIVQGALAHENWIGRADILRRVDKGPSRFGAWSYEAVDTKLAR